MKKIILLCLIGYAGCVSAMIPNQQVDRRSYKITELYEKNTEAIRTLSEEQQQDHELVNLLMKQNCELLMLMEDNIEEIFFNE